MLILAPAVGGTPAFAQSSGADWLVVVSPQPVHRPTLDRIERTAQRQGISLAEAMDRYVAETVRARPALAARGDASLPDVMIDDLPLAELVDLRLIADSEGIGYAEAIDRFAWQPRFERVADHLQKAYPAAIAEAAIIDDGRRARFGFKGKIPAAAVRLARTLPVTVELKGGKGYSEADLERAMNAAHASVARRSDFSHVYSSYDADTGVISIEARPARPGLSRARRDRLRAAAQPARPGNPKIKVRLSVGYHPVARPADRVMRGGGRVTGCTAGFTVKTIKGSQKGISTAGHCAGSKKLTYSLHSSDGATRTTITRKRRHQGSSGDLAWYTRGSFSVARTFYYDWHKKRYADHRSGMPKKGTRICKFGMTTSATCSTVDKANVKIKSGGITYSHMVTMKGGGVRPGDSGGPWYYGGTAYGLTHGYFVGTSRSIFTPAYLLQNLGVDVYQR